MSCPGSLFAIPDLPATAGRARTLTCTCCGAAVDVYEIPRRFLQPGSYVCGICLCDPEPKPPAETNA